MVKVMGFLTTTANFQPKEGLSDSAEPLSSWFPVGNPHAPPLWPGLEGGTSPSPATLGTAWGMQQRPKTEWRAPGDLGDIIRPISKVVPFALGRRGGTQAGTTSWKAKGQARFSVAVVIRLEWTFTGHAQVLGLLLQSA